MGDDNQARANELIEQANALHAEGNKAATVPLYQEAIGLYPAYGMFNLVVGDSLRDLGRLPEAADAYRALVTAEPEHDQAWQSLGEIAHELGNEDEAKHALLQAQELRGEAEPDQTQSQEKTTTKKPGFFSKLFGR